MNQLKLPIVFSMLFLAACGSQNPDRQAPPEAKAEYVTVQGSQSTSLNDPKVNILFVVDNSGSMQGYQDKMARNIEFF